MKIHSVLLPCLAVVVVVATEFANVAFAIEDDFHNCINDPGGQAATCSALHRGSTGVETGAIFTFGLFGNGQTGTITNIGKMTYDVYIEQFVRFEVVRSALKPGETYHFGAFDKIYPLYSLIIGPPYPDPSAMGRIVIDQPSPSNRQCADQCTTRFDGCHQGCAQIPNSGAACLAGCDAAQAYCLAHCSP